MFAISYIISLFKTSPKNASNSVNQEVANINSNSNPKKDENKKQNETCEEDSILTRKERECITDSEESGLEYESATDGDTLVNSDESDDDVEDILDAPLIQLITQADEKERKHISKDEKGRRTHKETSLHKKRTSVDKNQMKEKDKVKENMTDIEKSMMGFDNNKKHTCGDEESNMERETPEDNLIGNDSRSTKESDNIERNYLISSSTFETESCDLPTPSETVLSVFTVEAKEVSGNDDIRNETDDVPIPPSSMPNKPTAIVKPCQKIVNKNDSTMKLNLNLKTSDLKKVNSPQQEDTNTGVISKDESKDIHDDLNSLSKEKKLDNENKEITRTKMITEKDVNEKEYELKRVENETKSICKDIKYVEENNKQMVTIVEEFEKTINQLVMEKEREDVCQQIVMERIAGERDDVVSDHQNVENAFVDLSHKYERTKQVVTGLQMGEDNLKQSLEDLTTRYTEGEQKYEDAKTEAEDQLARVGITLEARQRAKGLEIARLTAQLRKAEMNVSSLEEEIDQKTQENKELTGMCDDLLVKLETAS